MPPVARLTDTHSHGGSIITGSPDHYDQGLPVARVTDQATCVLHGVVTIVTGSGQTFVNGLALARIGDSLSCGSTISSGSSQWTDNG